MKKLIILLLSIITLNVTAQVDTSIVNQQNITEAERIIDKYSTKVSETVVDIVDELKGPAEAVFKTVVKLQIAKGIGCLLILIPLIILWKIFFVYYKKCIDYAEKNPKNGFRRTWNETPFSIIAILSLIIGIILMTASIFSIYHGILQVLAPEWFAIKELIELAK